MANRKISELNELTGTPAGTDIVPMVDGPGGSSAETKKVTVTNLMGAAPVQSVAGRTGAVTLSNSDVSGLGSAATQNVGTSAGNVVQLDSSGNLPAVDGSNLTNVGSAGSVTSSSLASDSVTTTKIEDGAVTGSKIGTGTITNTNITNTTITGGKLVNNTITSTQLATDAVGTSEIADGAVTDAKLASGVGTSAGNFIKLDSTGKLPAVDGSQLTGVASGSAGSVDSTALASDAVTTTKIEDGAVTGSKIGSGTITDTNIQNTTITGGKLVNNTITSTHIAANAVDTSELADGSVTKDKLNSDVVDPSGGVELGANGLKLATSASATRVQLHVNSTTGIAFVAGTSHEARTSGYIITDKFATWSDAFSWMSYNLASTAVRVDLIIENDVTETMSAQVFWRTNNVRYGNINIWSKALFDTNPYSTPSSTAITNPTLTINVDQNSDHSSRFIFWLENVVTIRGINFEINLGAKGTQFHCIHRALESRVTFTYCSIKVTANSGQRLARVVESVNGGLIRVTSDLYNTHPNRDDPFNNGGRAHGLELDLVGVPIIDNVFSIANSASTECIEFRPDTTTDLSGVHFKGSGTCTIGNVFLMAANSRIETNTKFTRSSATTMAGNSVVRASGYNSVFFNQFSEDTDADPAGGTSAFPKFPGTSAFHSTSSSPADYVTSNAFSTNPSVGPVATNSLDIEANYL